MTSRRSWLGEERVCTGLISVWAPVDTALWAESTTARDRKSKFQTKVG